MSNFVQSLGALHSLKWVLCRPATNGPATWIRWRSDVRTAGSHSCLIGCASENGASDWSLLLSLQLGSTWLSDQRLMFTVQVTEVWLWLRGCRSVGSLWRTLIWWDHLKKDRLCATDWRCGDGSEPELHSLMFTCSWLLCILRETELKIKVFNLNSSSLLREEPRWRHMYDSFSLTGSSVRSDFWTHMATPKNSCLAVETTTSASHSTFR